MKLSKHARMRAQQRGIPEKSLSVVFDLGSCVNCQDGAMIYILSNKDCDEQIAALKREISVLEKSRGKVVIAKDDLVVTAYHSREGNR